MKKTIFTLFMALLFGSTFAQTDKIEVDASKKSIQVGKLTITSKTTIEEIIKVLGEPERKEVIAGKDRIYAYDKQGLAFDIGPSGSRTIEAVVVTYNYDNDKKVASGKYAGELFIDGFKVTKLTKSKELTAKTKLGEIACFGTMCVGNPKSTAVFAVVLGYTTDDQAEITQIGFGFKK